MRGVLGGFKNMLRQWRINYLRNKKKKQQEIEKGTLSKYYTLKRIAYSSLALICSPFGLFYSEKKGITKEYPELIKIKENIVSIQKKASEISPRQKEKAVAKIQSQIKAVERKMDKTIFKKSSVVQKEAIQMIQQLKKEVVYLKEPITLKTKEVSIQPNSSKENSVPLYSNKTVKEAKNHIMKVHFEPIEAPIFSNLPFKKEKSEKRKDCQPLPCDKDIEKGKIKRMQEEVKTLTFKISTNDDYALFYEYEKKLKKCKKELEEMKDELAKANLIQLLSDMETKEREKPIMELLDKVNKIEKTIRDKKDALYNAKSSDKQNKIEKKEEPKKEEQKKKEIPISEWQQAQMMIMKQLENQQKQIIGFEKRRNKTKKSLFKTLSNLAMNAIHFLFSFTPLTIFKNKILGTFVTTVMVNNSLKSMKRLLHPAEAINYEWLGEELKEKQAILENTYRVSQDSLYQINTIKEDVLFLLKDNPENIEILTFLQQLETIEKETLSINQQVKKEANIIDKQYTKIFTKGA